MYGGEGIELAVPGEVSAWLRRYYFGNGAGIVNGRIKNIAYLRERIIVQIPLPVPFCLQITGQSARVD